MTGNCLLAHDVNDQERDLGVATTALRYATAHFQSLPRHLHLISRSRPPLNMRLLKATWRESVTELRQWAPTVGRPKRKRDLASPLHRQALDCPHHVRHSFTALAISSRPRNSVRNTAPSMMIIRHNAAAQDCHLKRHSAWNMRSNPMTSKVTKPCG